MTQGKAELLWMLCKTFGTYTAYIINTFHCQLVFILKQHKYRHDLILGVSLKNWFNQILIKKNHNL